MPITIEESATCWAKYEVLRAPPARCCFRLHAIVAAAAEPLVLLRESANSSIAASFPLREFVVASMQPGGC
jgi:hypothetical protein